MRKSRQVKLDEVLARLIDQQGYSRARKIICREIGISPSALAQYMKHSPPPEEKAQGAKTVRPSFEVLVALADFFEVSLDYLVYGEQAGAVQPLDYGPLGRYIDKALFDAQVRNDARVITVARIAQRLTDQLDRVAQEVVETNTATGADLLTCDESLNTESCSRESWIITMDMHNDILEPGGPAAESEAIVPGRFFQVVARNVSRGRKYRFLLPYGVRDWTPLVSAYHRLLQRQCGNDQVVLDNALFRCTSSPLLTGCALLHLDTAEMETLTPILYEQLRPAVNPDHWLGLILPPSNLCQHAAVMDAAHLTNALTSFRQLWDTAFPITSLGTPASGLPLGKGRRG
jgi:transcriptional regulator with XRE-family HTH domain